MDLYQNIRTVYLAKPEFVSLVAEEVGEQTIFDAFIFSSHPPQPVCFAKDIWFNPHVVPITSISAAAKILRAQGKYWYLHPFTHVRRSKLIQEQLRPLPTLERTFPLSSPIPPIGGFTLLDKNTLLYSTARWKPWPDGNCYFIEDKIHPPNRAYLKLWEALTWLGKYPQVGDRVLDLGAAPGGWTYVMQSFGAQVTAVDKADLAPQIAHLPGVTPLKQSAFALDPLQLTETYDWVLSDVICYPERALQLIKRWIQSQRARQLIFTIKLQGERDLAAIKPFQAIPHAHITNLFYNKHEATFFLEMG